MSDLMSSFVYLCILAFVCVSLKFCDRGKIQCVPINAMVNECYKGERK